MSKPPALRVVDDQPEGFGQAPPHNIQAEQVVLGAVMVAPPTLAEVRDLIDASCFYRPAHALIWDTITALADRGDPYHVIPVSGALGRDLSKVGGGPYLHTLIASVPTAAQAGYYAHLLRRLAHARRVIEAGHRMVAFGHQAAGDDLFDLRGSVTAECAAITTADAHGWPDPVPLSASPALPAFPVWCLPDWLGEYAAGVAEATQTPVDLAGCLALAVLAVAAGGKVWIRPRALHRWREPANLYTVIVLPPGSRKSEVFAAMSAPIKAAEKTLISDAAPAIQQALIARRVAEKHAEKATQIAENADPANPAARAAALAEAQDAAMALQETTVPAEPALYSANATPEKLTSRLAEQGGRFAVLAPEGKIFAIAAGLYGKAPDLEVFLSGHAGEEMRIDRVGRPSERIDSATLTLGVCIQPGVLTRFADTPQFRDEGLLGRLLFSLPESMLGYRNENADPIGDDTTHAYETNITTLTLSLHNLPEPRTLTFTPEAEQAVTAHLAALEQRLRPDGGDLAHMTDWAGKLVGACVRIAGLLHLAKHFRTGWDRPIDADTFTAATEIGAYFTTHAQAAYDTIGADPAVNAARAVTEWLASTGTARFTTRDLMRAGRIKHRFPKASDTEPALRVLETHGWIRRLPTPPSSGKGGRAAAPTYETHPAALEPTP